MKQNKDPVLAASGTENAYLPDLLGFSSAKN
jgi:hypothetical protein